MFIFILCQITYFVPYIFNMCHDLLFLIMTYIYFVPCRIFIKCHDINLFCAMVYIYIVPWHIFIVCPDIYFVPRCIFILCHDTFILHIVIYLYSCMQAHLCTVTHFAPISSICTQFVHLLTLYQFYVELLNFEAILYSDSVFKCIYSLQISLTSH